MTEEQKRNKKKQIQALILFKSIRTSMIFWFFLLIAMTLLIFFVLSISYTERTVADNSIEYTERLIRQVNRDIDSYITYMDDISTMVLNVGDVQQYLFSELDEEEKEELYDRIVTQFNTVIDIREDISNIAVVSEDGEFIINDGKDQINGNIPLQEVDWYRDALQEEDSILTASHVQYVIKNNYKWVVTMGRGIQNPNTGRKEAVFFIDLNYKLLEDLCKQNSLATDDYIFILDETGKIIYHPKQKLLYSGLKKEKIDEVLNCKGNYFVADDSEGSRLYTVSVGERTGWRVVGVVSTAELMGDWEETQQLYLFAAAMLLLLALLLAILFAEAITRPITQLKTSMKKVEKGDFEEAIVIVDSDNEIGELSNSFNSMAARIRQLIEQNRYEQEQKRRSELKALRSQINPHFLYNTLDSIIWMSEGGKTEEVVRMTSALARLLRQSISNDNERIPIEKEVEYVKSYLTIQQMRYKDKLEYEIQVEPAIRNELIINLILQPLVENAIYHGIKYKGTKGMIQITGYKEENNIILKVTDNGIGMSEEALADILKRSKAKEGSNGVGVYNVHTRIQLYYGEAYGLQFASVQGKGTEVTIVIPLDYKEEI